MSATQIQAAQKMSFTIPLLDGQCLEFSRPILCSSRNGCWLALRTFDCIYRVITSLPDKPRFDCMPQAIPYNRTVDWIGITPDGGRIVVVDYSVPEMHVLTFRGPSKHWSEEPVRFTDPRIRFYGAVHAYEDRRYISLQPSKGNLIIFYRHKPLFGKPYWAIDPLPEKIK